MTSIYLDENLSQYVAEALNLLNKKDFKKFKVDSTIRRFNENAPDEVIIPGIGAEQGILITKDFKIKTTVQYELCKKHKVGVFFFKPEKKQYRHWDIVRLLIKHWEDMMKIISTKERPFGYLIKTRGKIEELK